MSVTITPERAGAEGDTHTINFGPQHPAAHGVLRLILEMKGEVVERADPHIGLLHRGTEKLIEHKTYIQALPYFDRLDYVSPMCMEHAFALATERLLGIEGDVPERARYIRVLFSEITRILNHLLNVTTYALDCGAITPALWGFEQREHLLEMYEMTSGSHYHANYFRPGGVAKDIPAALPDKIRRWAAAFPAFLDDLERLLTDNRIFKQRTVDIGVMTAEQAIAWGFSGPCLRASGVPWDLRKVDHYECYDDFDWAVAWEKEGDCFARYRVRVQEMRESLKILRQACAMIPGGPTENLEARRMAEGKGSEFSGFDYQYVAKKVAPTFKIPEGELYTRLESGKGEIGVFIQGNNDVTPWRFKIRAADQNNLQILPHILKGHKVADIMAILGSIDVIMGSVDR